MSDTILVTGATGQQGGAVARSLLKQGRKVRTLSRSIDKLKELKELGAEPAVGDLTDGASIEAALKGIRQAFLVTTPFEAGPEVEAARGIEFVDAAKAAGVENLVFSSVASAYNTGVPILDSKGKIQTHIKGSGIPATILNPVWFMENFGTWFLQGIQEGKLVLPLTEDYTLQMTDLDTIGAFGAAAFLRPAEFLGKEISIATDGLTLPETMRLLSKQVGKSIAYGALPAEKAEGVFGPDLAKLFHWLQTSGFAVDLQKVAQWGIPLTKFKDHIRTAAWVKKAGLAPEKSAAAA